jgi:hypothetical protein
MQWAESKSAPLAICEFIQFTFKKNQISLNNKKKKDRLYISIAKHL